jgi:hypothetical protein
MHTRPISRLVFLGLLAACESTNEPVAPSGPSLSAAGIIRDNFKFELEQTFDCTAAGGEIIDFSGTVHQTLTIVLKGDDFIHVTVAFAGQGITGIGRSSGDTYRVTGMGLENVTERVRESGGMFVFTFLDLTHLVAGDGTLWGAKLIQHVTVTPSGQVVENEFDAGDCVQL